jgi:hypothetical protein
MQLFAISMTRYQRTSHHAMRPSMPHAFFA